MADTGKNIRSTRTSVEQRLGGLPTERTQLVPQEVHQFRSLATGLEGLNQVFDNFLGNFMSASDAVAHGVAVGERAKIEQQNAAQKRQALGDALAGKPMDPAAANDLDYYDAYRSVTAQKDGFKAASDFQQFYLQDWLPNNPTGDLAAAREEWMAKNLMGSQDKQYEGQVLAQFVQNTDELVAKHKEYAFKYQTDKGLQNLWSSVEATISSGQFDEAWLSDTIDKARALDPLNASEAPARVMSTLFNVANQHPDQMQAVAALLAKPGTGVNGKSFAQSFPDAYSEFQNKAVASWQQVNTLSDLKAVSDLEDKVAEATSADELAKVAADAIQFKTTRGGANQIDPLLSKIDAKAKQLQVQQDGIQTWATFLQGDTSAIPDNKYWSAFSQSLLGTSDILSAQDQTLQRRVMSGFKGISVPDELKAQLTSGLLNMDHPDRQAAAFALISTLASRESVDYAKKFLDDDAWNTYRHVATLAQLTNANAPAIIEKINKFRSEVKDWNIGWEKVTGDKNSTDAEKKVLDLVDAKMREKMGDPTWGSSTGFSADVKDTLLDTARIYAFEAEKLGRGWEAGVSDALNDIVGNAEVIPGADGRDRLTLRADTTAVWEDSDGIKHDRVRLGYQVPDPVTGEPRNTVKIYRQQLDMLVKTMPSLFTNGSPDGVTIRPPTGNMVFKQGGLFQVEEDGAPVQLVPGAKMILQDPNWKPFQTSGYHLPQIDLGITKGKVGTDLSRPQDPPRFTEVSIPPPPTNPNDPGQMEAWNAEVKAFADKYLPEGFVPVVITTPRGPILQLGYRPNFGTELGKTIDQQEAAYNAKHQ